MKYLIFPKFNINHLLFLSYFIIQVINDIFNHYYRPTKDIVATFHKYYICSLSDFLSIIPVIIIKKRSQIKKAVNNKIDTFILKEIVYIHTNDGIKNLKNKNKRLNKLIILISFFEFLAEYLNVIFDIINEQSYNEVNMFNLNSVLIINIILKYLFSFLILHSHFHRHHYLSLIINIIFLIVLEILDIREILYNKYNYFIAFLYIATRALSIIFFSLEDVYAKIILSYDSISPYTLLFYRAIFLNSFAVLFSFIFIFVPLPDENNENSIIFTRFWKIYEDKLIILQDIGIFIFQFLSNLNIFFIIDKFSPNHVPMASTIENLGFLLNSILIFREVEIEEFFIRSVLYIILFVAASIHNELIVIHCCGLETHTRLFMEKLAEKDNYNLNYNIINDNFLNENKQNNEDINDLEYDENRKQSIELIKIEENSLDEHKDFVIS